jgi:hypothetical protein
MDDKKFPFITRGSGGSLSAVLCEMYGIADACIE